jgi:RNA polymerase sigma factor (sigma-70 family)
MNESFGYDPNKEDPYKPQFLPKEEHLDPFSEEPTIEQHNTVMSEWDKEYQKHIENLTPDELLLTTEEESELARRIQLGKSAMRELAHDNIDVDLRRALQEQVDSGLLAKEELVLRNLRLAAWFVRKSMDLDKRRRIEKGRGGQRGAIVQDLSSLSGGQLEYSDRMQLATIGLMQAADIFKPGGGRFSTVSMFEMESILIKSIQDDTLPLKIPVGKSQDINRVARVRRQLQQDFGREATYEELEQRTNLGVDYLQELDRLAAARQHISFEDIADRYKQSLGDDVEDDGPDGASDILPDQGVRLSVEDEVVLKDMGRVVDDMLEGLSERERFVIIFRFGLDDGEPRTLEEVGSYLGVTRERVRQLEARAFSGLRSTKQVRSIANEIVYGADSDPTNGVRPVVPLSEYDEAQMDLKSAPLTSKGSSSSKSHPNEAKAAPQGDGTYTLAEYRRREEAARAQSDELAAKGKEDKAKRRAGVFRYIKYNRMGE